MYAIEVKNVQKFYKDKEVLKNISFNVEEKKITAFLGNNGAGKTTTLHIIVRSLISYVGEVKIFGKSNKESGILKDVSFVPSENWNIPAMKVKKFLELSAGLTGIPKARVKKDVSEIISVLGLSEIQNNHLTSLSSGQLKKVSIAQGLISRPKVMILDEPAANLDPGARQDVYDLLKKIKNKGITVLVSTHILDDMETFVDNVVFIKSGNILGQVKISEFKKKNESFSAAFARWNKIEVKSKPSDKLNENEESLLFWNEEPSA